MRVAFISPGYAPSLGGVETHVTHVAEGLVALGVEVEVWAADRSVQQVTARPCNGVMVTRFPRTRSDRYPLAPSLWRHVRNRATTVDILHSQSYHVTSSLAGLVAPDAVPLVLTPHYHGTGHTRLSTLMHRPYRLLGARLFKRAAGIIAVSAFEQSLIIRDFPAAAPRCRVIHNGVDADWIKKARPYPKEPPTLLALGRIERYKRLDLLLRAFSKTAAQGQLVVLGDGPDLPRLRALAQELPRRNEVRFLGRVESDDVARWLRTASAIVSLSEHEAFGLVALEGLAAGAQAILSDLAAHREVLELVESTAGVLVQADNLPALCNALDAALTAPHGEPCPVRDWGSVARDHLELYKRCLIERAS